MRIIQIVGGGVTSEGDEGTVYGLGDDGGLYEFWSGHKPTVTKVAVQNPQGGWKKDEKGFTVYDPRYVDGATRGWKLVCTSDARSTSIPHPEDPTRHERS